MPTACTKAHGHTIKHKIHRRSAANQNDTYFSAFSISLNSSTSSCYKPQTPAGQHWFQTITPRASHSPRQCHTCPGPCSGKCADQPASGLVSAQLGHHGQTSKQLSQPQSSSHSIDESHPPAVVTHPGRARRTRGNCARLLPGTPPSSSLIGN